VKPQAATRCVHLSTEVTPVWLFTAVAPDMIVVVARSCKALTTHVTRIRFLTSVQADVIHQANAGCQYLVAMWTFQLLAPSLVADPWIRFPGSGLCNADSPLTELKQDLAVVFWLSTSLPRAKRGVGREVERSGTRRGDTFRARIELVDLH